MDKYFDERTKLEMLREQNDSLENNMLSGEELAAKLSDTKNKYEILNRKLPPKIYQDQIILFLDDLVNTYNLDVSGYAFADTKSIDNSVSDRIDITKVLKEYEEHVTEGKNVRLSTIRNSMLYAKKKDVENETEITHKLDLFSVNMTAFGTYKDLKGFLRFLEEDKQKIIIKNISVTKDSTLVDNIVVSINLEFPYYDDGTDGSNRLNLDYIRTDDINPFTFKNLGYSTEDGLSTNESTSNNPYDVKVSYEESDFYLVLKPETSDASNITIGKTPDRASALYGDSRSSQSADIRIRQQGKILSFNYGTENKSYPAVGTYKEFDLSNDGKIIIEVQSQKRLPNNDINGATLNINNESEYPVYVHVFDDDSDNPRLIVKGIKGSVSTVKH
jgi:hypothetical protein